MKTHASSTLNDKKLAARFPLGTPALKKRACRRAARRERRRRGASRRETPTP